MLLVVDTGNDPVYTPYQDAANPSQLIDQICHSREDSNLQSQMRAIAELPLTG